MTEPLSLVETYLHAFYAGDPKTRDLLADDFHFTGPSAHLHGADAFLKASGHAVGAARSIEIDKIFADGGDVAAFYTVHLSHEVPQMRVAERFRVESGRIFESALIMDTAPFLKRPRSAAAQELATDPVCHMDVDKAAPAATREYRGTVYYFCSTSCASAFDKEPEKYLAT